MRRFAIVLSLTAAFMLLSGSAWGQTDSGVDGHIEYRFDDDALAAESRGPWLDWFRGRTRAPRAMLIRPRVHFVAELLKSTETL